jgi:hypothetical protein
MSYTKINLFVHAGLSDGPQGNAYGYLLYTLAIENGEYSMK